MIVCYCAHHHHDHTTEPVGILLTRLLENVDTLGELIVSSAQTTADTITAELGAVLSDYLAQQQDELAVLAEAQAAGKPVDLAPLQEIADKLRAAVPTPTAPPVVVSPEPATVPNGVTTSPLDPGTEVDPTAGFTDGFGSPHPIVES